MRYGTRKFFGLDTQTSPHLLEDGELTVAENVNFDMHGAVKPAVADLQLTTPNFESMNGIGIGTVGGVTYGFFKVSIGGVWRVYRFVSTETPVQITDPQPAWSSGQLRVYQGNNAVILADGDYVRVWHGPGGVLRDLGPLPAGTGFGAENQIVMDTADELEVSAVVWSIDNADSEAGHVYVQRDPIADPRVVEHGEYFYLNCSTAPAVHLRHFKASVNWPVSGDPIASGSTFHAVEDNKGNLFQLNDSGSAASIPADARYYPSGCGLIGTYRYAVSYTIKLPDGITLERQPEYIPFPGGQESRELDVGDVVTVQVAKITDVDIDAYLHDLGDSSFGDGDDVEVGITLYRTKMNASTLYVLYEATHDESYTEDDSGVQAFSFTERFRDDDLGAVAPIEGSHGEPPLFRDAVVGGNRFHVVDESDRRKLYFSFVGDMDYWNVLDYVQFPEQLTAVASMPGFVACFSATRCWLYDNDDGVGYLVEIPVKLGVPTQDAVLSESSNVYFGNALGLWELSGSRIRNVASPVEDDWRSASGDWVGASLGGKMIWAPSGTTQAYVIKLSEDGIRWGMTDIDDDYQLIIADPSRNRFLVQMDTGIWVHAGGTAAKTMNIRSKEYGEGVPGGRRRVVLDASGDVDGHVWVVSNYHPEPDPMKVKGRPGQRRLIPLNLPKMEGEFWVLAFTGTGTIYGWWVEVDQNDPAY